MGLVHIHVDRLARRDRTIVHPERPLHQSHAADHDSMIVLEQPVPRRALPIEPSVASLLRRRQVPLPQVKNGLPVVECW